jgi:hypothetical protein
LDAFAKTSSIPVLAVVSDNTKVEDIKKFYADNGIKKLDTILDVSGIIAKQCGIASIPATLILDAKGHERGRFVGALEWATPGLEAAIVQTAAITP